jgi:hypothetical protein
MAHPRNLIVAEERKPGHGPRGLCLAETGRAFSGVVTEMVAGEHTVLHHYRIEREDTQVFHVSTLRTSKDAARVSILTRYCWAALWCATTCTRCWPARAANA